MIEQKCEGCGTITTTLRASDVVYHAACPNRKPRGVIPQYVPVEARRTQVVEDVPEQRRRTRRRGK